MLRPQHRDDEGRYLDWQSEAFAETRFDLTDRVVVVGSGRFNYYLSHDGGTDTLFEAALHEAYGDILLGNLGVRIGRQILTWGKTDIVSPLDNLNPLDLRHFVDPLPETMKIPVLMVKADYSIDKWTVEGVYIPFFESSTFDAFGSDFSLLKHSFPDLHFGGVLGLFEHLGWVRFPQLPPPDAMDPHVKTLANDLLRATEYPRDNFLEGDYGIAVKGTWRKLDVELSYLYAWDDFPSYRLDPTLARSLLEGTFDERAIAELLRLVEAGDYSSIASGRFYRMHVAGGGISLAWKQCTFRGEGAYFHKRTFYTTTLEPFQSPAVFYVLGADYTYGDKYILHVQGFHHRLLETRKDPIGIDRDTYGLTGYATAFFLDASLVAELRVVYFFDSRDLMVNPRATYSVTDHFSVSVGGYILQGSGPNRLNTYRDLLRLTPVSYFSDNDAIFISLKYSF